MNCPSYEFPRIFPRGHGFIGTFFSLGPYRAPLRGPLRAPGSAICPRWLRGDGAALRPAGTGLSVGLLAGFRLARLFKAVRLAFGLSWLDFGLAFGLIWLDLASGFHLLGF